MTSRVILRDQKVLQFIKHADFTAIADEHRHILRDLMWTKKLVQFSYLLDTKSVAAYASALFDELSTIDVGDNSDSEIELVIQTKDMFERQRLSPEGFPLVPFLLEQIVKCLPRRLDLCNFIYGAYASGQNALCNQQEQQELREGLLTNAIDVFQDNPSALSKSLNSRTIDDLSTLLAPDEGYQLERELLKPSWEWLRELIATLKCPEFSKIAAHSIPIIFKHKIEAKLHNASKSVEYVPTLNEQFAQQAFGSRLPDVMMAIMDMDISQLSLPQQTYDYVQLARNSAATSVDSTESCSRNN